MQTEKFIFMNFKTICRKTCLSVLRYLHCIILAVFGKAVGQEEIDAVREEVRLSYKTEVGSLQNLVENLRERIGVMEKNARNTDRNIGNLMKASQMLDKTNNSLTDLCNYMELGDAEALRAMTESMEWSSTLLRIIKSHLLLLSRKNELEQRQREASAKRMEKEDNFNLE